MELFFNRPGLRVYIGKSGGLFRKTAGRRGIYGSDPLDHDPVTQDEPVRRSNRGRSLSIRWLRSQGTGPVALGHQRWLPAAASRWSSPELAKSGTPGVLSGGAWPGREYAACVIHLGLVRGAGRLGATCAKAVAGLHSGARRRGEFGRFWCGNLGAKASWSTCEAKASQCGSCAGLRSAAASSPRRTAVPAAAERQRAPFRPLRWSTCPWIYRNR